MPKQGSRAARSETSTWRRSEGLPRRRPTRPTTSTPPLRTERRWAPSSSPGPCAERSRRREVTDAVAVGMTVNGRQRRALVEPRKTLADYLREDCALTGTHLGCEHGVCGACTVLLDGEAVRACLLFAIQAEGAEVSTVEGLTPVDGGLTTVQEAFREAHGLQCGFCTPGFIVSVTAFLRDHASPTDQEIREGLSGNLCRCTGYQGIVNAVRLAAGRDYGVEQLLGSPTRAVSVSQ